MNNEIQTVIEEIQDLLEFNFTDTGDAQDQLHDTGYINAETLRKGNEWMGWNQMGSMQNSYFNHLKTLTPDQQIKSTETQMRELDRTNQMSSSWNPVTRFFNTDSNKMREFYDNVQTANNQARLQGKTGLNYGMEYARQNVLPTLKNIAGIGIGTYVAKKGYDFAKKQNNQEYNKNFQNNHNINVFQKATGAS